VPEPEPAGEAPLALPPPLEGAEAKADEKGAVAPPHRDPPAAPVRDGGAPPARGLLGALGEVLGVGVGAGAPPAAAPLGPPVRAPALPAAAPPAAAAVPAPPRRLLVEPPARRAPIAYDVGDGEDGQFGEYAAEAKEQGLHRRVLHPSFYANLEATGGSCHAFTQVLQTKEQRNKHELMALAEIADALYENDIDHAKELVVRRYIGVKESDKYGNWAMADALRLERSAGSLLDRDVELVLLASANRMSRAVNTASRGRFTGQRGGRQSGYPFPSDVVGGQYGQQQPRPFARGRGGRRGRGRGGRGGAALNANAGGAAEE
jgi:hypothetical protein